MAPEKKDKKRKATSATAVTAPDPPKKKSKKTAVAEQTPEVAPKSILKKKNAEAKTNGEESARKIKPRKRASDYLSDEEEEEEEEEKEDKSEVEKESKPTKTKKQAVKSAKEEKVEKKETKTKKVEVVVVEEEKEDDDEVENEDDGQGEDDEIDDQTAELIKGFESSGDEDASGDEGFEAGKPVPKIPDSKKAKRKIQKKLKESDKPDEPGTVYVGRIPHGFYEHQMRAYFSQFGEITRLRLSRNRVTGRSKHYAFIEFASSVVANIVAETMNNYLMYGHILKCKYVPQEQQHPELWKGANRRYKRVPWNRIEKQRLDRGKTRDKWAQSIEQEEKRRLAKAEKLKQLGYEFEMPALKTIDSVPVQEKLPAPEATEEAVVETEEKENAAHDDKEVAKVATVAADEETPKKKKSTKKAKKDTESETTEVKTTPAKSTEEKQTPSETSTKKGKSKKAKKSAGKA